MVRGTLSRRGFLSRSMAALTMGAGLPYWFAREVLAAEEEAVAKARRKRSGRTTASRFQARSVLQGHGYLVMTEAVQKRANVQLVAACDVDATRRRAAIAKSKLRGIDEYGDFRELLQRKDIDAVTVVTPDHWHALIAVAALRAGKDVYCEKPMTLTIDEGKILTKVANSCDRIVQVGTHQRSDARFRLACELVRNGRIGRVTRVETRVGANPKRKYLYPSPVPDGLDWDFWLGQTPHVPYIKERCHYNFRWWYEYSGGKVTDWGAHHNDIAQWGLGADETGPVAVEAEDAAASVRLRIPYSCPTDFTISYTYADDAQARVLDQGKNGVKFIGENGWIFVDRAHIEASDSRLIDEPLPATATRLFVSTDHILNFLECITQQPRKPICDTNIGHRSRDRFATSAISRSAPGSHSAWDPHAPSVFVRPPRPGQRGLLSREMRQPWTLTA